MLFIIPMVFQYKKMSAYSDNVKIGQSGVNILSPQNFNGIVILNDLIYFINEEYNHNYKWRTNKAKNITYINNNKASAGRHLINYKAYKENKLKLFKCLIAM